MINEENKPQNVNSAPKPVAAAPTPQPPVPKPSRVPWNPLVAVIFTVVLYFVSQIVGSLLVIIYPLSHGMKGQAAQDWITNSVNGQFFYVLLAEAAVIGAVWGFIKFCEQGWSLVGVVKKLRSADVSAALLAFPIYFGMLAVGLTLVQHLVPGFKADQAQDIGFNSVHGPEQLILTFVSLVVLPPLAEEILLRGFLYTSLRKWLNFGWATVAVSVLFAIAHLPEGGSDGPLYVAAVDTFLLSLVLCYLREKRGSIWAGVMVHMLKNGIAFMSLFVIGGR